MAFFEVSIVDAVEVADGVSVSKGFGVTVSDTVEAIDSIVVESADLIDVVINDAVVVTDVATNVFERVVSDAVAVVDQVAVQLLETLSIANARALSNTKVRIDFTAPALDEASNPGLTDPSSYLFTVASPGAIEVVPQAIELPPGQVNPLFVEVIVTEHTDGAIYGVQLAAGAILSAVGGASGGDVANYAGLGDSPIVDLVFATGENEVQVVFSESLFDNAAARNINNYVWDGGLATISVKDVSENIVTLETSDQTEGFLYNLTVRGVLAVAISDRAVVVDQVSAVII